MADNTGDDERVWRRRLSGKEMVGLLVLHFVIAACLIPTVFRLPLWLDFEFVLAAWWLIWWVVLARLLYTGRRVADDHQFGQPRNWLAGVNLSGNSSKKNNSSDSSWWDGFFWGSVIDSEAVAIGCAVVIGFIVLLGLAWFLIEVAIPLVVFLLYFIVRGMLAHVINDRHHCRANLLRALAWSFVWASIYTVPLAGVVWFVHHAQRPPLE